MFLLLQMSSLELILSGSYVLSHLWLFDTEMMTHVHAAAFKLKVKIKHISCL